jgi:hypothetical protein
MSTLQFLRCSLENTQWLVIFQHKPRPCQLAHNSLQLTWPPDPCQNQAQFNSQCLVKGYCNLLHYRFCVKTCLNPETGVIQNHQILKINIQQQKAMVYCLPRQRHHFLTVKEYWRLTAPDPSPKPWSMKSRQMHTAHCISISKSKKWNAKVTLSQPEGHCTDQSSPPTCNWYMKQGL